MFNKFITKFEDLITTHEQTRAGFLKIALEKNAISDPYVKNAVVFKAMVKDLKSPEEILDKKEIRPFVLAASGLSDKSLAYLDEDDRDLAIKNLIEKFLLPSGKNFVDEIIYRYLLTKGDAVGGVMRNRIGAFGQEKLIRTIISCMNVQGISYSWISYKISKWVPKSDDDSGIEKDIKAICWNGIGGERILVFNMNLEIVKKNIDICLFNCNKKSYDSICKLENASATLMLGELKGGIDPAGADEHWKTAHTALERIRESYSKKSINIKTSFVGAAIQSSMAKEIYEQLNKGILTNAANLGNDEQLVEYCNWILEL